MNSTPRHIINGKIVLPDQVIKGSIVIQHGKIIRIERGGEQSTSSIDNVVIDAEGMYVFPGLIDIHGDAVEKEVQPRPNTLFPLDIAFYELEKKLAASGITTMYHSLSLGTGLSLRGEQLLVQMLQFIKHYRSRRAMIRHRIHLRYEILYQSSIRLAEQLLSDGTVDYFSYMLHAPGEGQYKQPGSFEAYVMKNQGVDQTEVNKIVDNVKRLANEIDWSQVKQLVQFALSRNIAVASHDDDSIEKVDRSMSNGVSVIEFPLNLETAAYASERDLYVCVGAPNVVRGQSHDRNMRAIEAIKSNAANIICSDYYPPAMLLAIFSLVKEGISLPDAVNMASLNPAKAVGIERNFGSIEVGKDADLLLVEDIDGYPSLRQTIVGGASVYESDFYRIA